MIGWVASGQADLSDKLERPNFLGLATLLE